ncbi:guanine nucleotide-binding protein G(s) subunit alpha isoforms XLas-like protein [Turdus rufiventris]|nr:guanine nucleotide-binding protein G(s) subunit alpha isoforms XLas-like protein [Turdus rufiventris]
MGLCYSLRPRLFGDAGGGGSISSAGAASEPEAPAEPHAAPQPQPLGVPLRPGGKPGGEADGPPLLLLQNGGGGNGAAPERQPALPKAGGPGLGGGGKAARQQALHQPPALQRTWEKLRLEEREAEKEARKVSKSIDRALKEQKREYKQTHRLLLLELYFILIWTVPAHEIALRGQHKLLTLRERLDNKLCLNNCYALFLLVNAAFVKIELLRAYMAGFNFQLSKMLSKDCGSF